MSFNYLTDEELNNMILNIEQNDIVEAPWVMKNNILERIDTISQIANQNVVEFKLRQKKIAEFRRFRTRVVVAVAAIVAFVMVGPKIRENMPDGGNLKMAEIDLTISEDSWIKGLQDSHVISNFINER